jgi:hypothetical protein
MSAAESELPPWDVASTIGRSSAKLRQSPFTEYCRDGNVTVRPPFLRAHGAKSMSLIPLSGPPEKCSSASASVPLAATKEV